MFPPYYLILVVIPFALCLLASWRTKSVFNKYSRLTTSRRLTGAQVAQGILDRNNISNVRIEQVGGFLSDHYDPKAKVLRLSPDVYSGYSMAAVGVAAHEVGHAIQDAKHYSPLVARTGLVPLQYFGSNVGIYMIFGSMMLGGVSTAVGAPLAWIGLALFSLGTLFTFITLPVEFDASRRALETLRTGGFVSPEELGGASQVLSAAAMTYVAAAVASLASLLYYAIQLGLIGRSRDE